jgi:hypothetical protein
MKIIARRHDGDHGFCDHHDTHAHMSAGCLCASHCKTSNTGDGLDNGGPGRSHGCADDYKNCHACVACGGNFLWYIRDVFDAIADSGMRRSAAIHHDSREYGG